MIFSTEILVDPFVLEIYEDILRYAPPDYMEYTESVLLSDLYFILGANLPSYLYVTHKMIHHRRDQ